MQSLLVVVPFAEDAPPMPPGSSTTPHFLSVEVDQAEVQPAVPGNRRLVVSDAEDRGDPLGHALSAA